MKTAFRDWPIRIKLVFILFVASALPIAIGGIVQYQNSKSIIEEDAAALLGARAEEIAGSIDQLNRNYTRLATRTSHSQDLITYIQSAEPEARAPLTHSVHNLLQLMRDHDPSLQGVGVVGPSGVVLMAIPASMIGKSPGGWHHVQEALVGRSSIADPFLAPVELGAVPLVAYSAPVLTDGQQVVGAVLLWVNMESLWNVVEQCNDKAGEGSFSVLYDNTGIRIAHSNNTGEIFHPGGVLGSATIASFVAEQRFGHETARLLETPIAMEAEFQRARGPVASLDVFRAFSPNNKQRNLIVGRRLSTVPWTLFHHGPLGAIEASVTRLVRSTLLASLTMLLLAMVAGVMMARWVMRSIVPLLRASKALAEGDLTVRVPVPGDDELGLLAATFNKMATALGTSMDELERTVTLRTEELAAVNQSLFTQNKALEERTAELTRQELRQSAYGRALAALTGATPLHEALQSAMREAAEAVSAVTMICYQQSDNALMLMPLASYAVVGAVTPIGTEGLPGEALRTQRVVTLNSVPDEIPLRFEAVVAAGRPAASVLVPLLAEGRAVGLLCVGALRALSTEQIAFLRDLSAAFALTMRRHALYETAERFMDELGRSNAELQVQSEELASSQEELAARNEELIRASRLKNEFLANMSHELRTPLNAVIGFSEVLLDETYGPVGVKQRACVSDILAAGKHLLMLINGVLDLSKIEAGRVDLQMARIDLADVVGQAEALMASSIEKKQIQLNVRVSPREFYVSADMDKLRQVILNLLSNAVKFTAKGGSVTMRATHATGQVRLSVIDTGIGIRDADASKLFQPFSQVDSGYARKFGGTGLGLSIAKSLVELMGGTIGFTSVPGRGSTFFFNLLSAADEISESKKPQRISSPPSVRALSPSGAPERALLQTTTAKASPTVLLVEPTEQEARFLKGTLTDAGYGVVRVATVEEALHKAIQPPAHAILIGLDTPEALETLLRYLQNSPGSAATPLVLLTGVELSATQLSNLPAVVRMVLPKGTLSGVELLDKLVNVLGSSDSSTDPGFKGPRVLVVDDSEINRRVVRSMLANERYELIEASDGETALRSARETPPDVILMDLEMPGMDGLEAIRQLRQDPHVATIPIIVITAHAMVGDREKAMQAGAVAYIPKPITRKDLCNALDEAAARSGKKI